MDGEIWTKAIFWPKEGKEVVVLTNYGDVFVMKMTADGWERPERFNKGEEPEWWINKPTVS